MSGIYSLAVVVFADGPTGNETQPNKADIRELFRLIDEGVAAAAVVDFVDGGWQTATAYTRNQALTHNDVTYRATADHTSGSTTEPGVGANWETVWEVMLGAIVLGDGSVTLAKLANVATDKLLGRDAAGSGAPTEIGVTGGLEFDGSNNLRMADGGTTNAKLADIATARIKGRSSASTGPVQDLTAAQVRSIIDLWKMASTITAASSIDLGAAAGDYVNINGTTTINQLGTATAGTRRWVRFNNAVTLVHNTSFLYLPGAANITTAGNDTACFVSLGSGIWYCLAYTRYSGKAIVSAYDEVVAARDGAANLSTRLDEADVKIGKNRRTEPLRVGGDIPPLYRNAVKGRFGRLLDTPPDHIGYVVGAGAFDRGTPLYVLDGDIYEMDGIRSVIRSVTDVVQNNFPSLSIFVSPADLATIGIVPDDVSPPTVSAKIGWGKSRMGQHNLANVSAWVVLRYGGVAQPGHDLATDVVFQQASGSVLGGWLGAGDADWDHDARMEEDSERRTFLHEGIPVPATYGGQPFTGMLLTLRGYPLEGTDAPVTIGMTDMAIVAGDSIEFREPYINEPEDLPSISSETGVTVALAAIGDSHTYTAGSLENYWPYMVATKLSTSGESFNYGVSGESSAEMIPRMAALIGEAPNMVGIYAGANDVSTTVEASPTPTDTVFTVADVGKLGVGGWITIGADTRQIASLDGTEVTLETALSVAPSGGATVEVDTQRNIEHMIDLLWNAQIYRVFVVGAHFRNFSSGSGRDTITSQGTAQTMRVKQKAAADSRGVPYVDTYRFFSSLIRVGSQTQGDFAGHVADGDAHLNATGEDYQIARGVEQVIRQQGWV